MYFDVSNRNIIMTMFNASDIGIRENTKFLLFLLFSATSLLMATGNPKLASAISRVNVGVISM